MLKKNVGMIGSTKVPQENSIAKASDNEQAKQGATKIARAC
jgi:hypothetical protein